jgi:hypothetical protein
MACSMLKAKGLSGYFWGEAIATAVYLLNRSPTRAVEGMTPFETWYGKKPGMAHLRTFGCVVHVKNTKPHMKKLDDRSTRMIFVGYESGSKAYRAYDPRTSRVHVTRDVVFDELAQWSWSEEDGAQGENRSEPFEIDMVTTTNYLQIPGRGQGEQSLLGGPEPPQVDPHSPTSAAQPYSSTPRQVELTSPPSAELDLDYDHDEDAPLKFQRIDNVLEPAMVSGLVAHVVQEELHAVSIEEPASLEDAVHEPSWWAAMLEEL